MDFLFWFHVASIGELNSILPIVDFYLKKNKKYNFLITTVTLSSFNELKKKYKNNRVFINFYLMILNSWLIIFLKIGDQILLHSEIWPNFIFKIKEENIPLYLLNARITKKTFKRWNTVKSLLQKII